MKKKQVQKPAARSVPLQAADYVRLASFRRALRRFLRFSEAAAASGGLSGPQYQALLAVRGNPEHQPMSINDLAGDLMIKHNSAVGLVDRLVEQKLLARQPAPDDGRKVLLKVTREGERMLQRLASVHRAELRRIGPQIYKLLAEIGESDR